MEGRIDIRGKTKKTEEQDYKAKEKKEENAIREHVSLLYFMLSSCMYCSEKHPSTERTSDCLSLKGLYIYIYTYTCTLSLEIDKEPLEC
jgi:hypothetical protein